MKRSIGQLMYYDAPVIAFAILVLTLSGQSHLSSIPAVAGFDKLYHLVEYGCFALLCARAWKGHHDVWPGIKDVKVIVGIIGIFAMVDEIWQSFIPGRTCSIWDWTADITGALIMMSIICCVQQAKYWMRISK